MTDQDKKPLTDSSEIKALKKRIFDLEAQLEEFKNSTTMYSESDERLRTLINTMPDFVCFKDGEGRWIEANDFAVNCFRLQGVEYKGRTDIQIAAFSPDFYDAFEGCIKSDKEAWESEKLYRLDEIIVAPNGHEFIFDVIKLPIFNSDGTRRALLVVGRDVTEQRRMVKAQRDMERSLQQKQKLESLGFLAGGIAHDFNNILAILLGNVELLRADSEGNSEISKYVDTIDHVTRRAADLSQQMLDYSGKGTFVTDPLDLSTIVNEMASLVESSKSKKAIIHRKLDFALPAINANATQIRQVVLNLITNASDALEGKNGDISIYTGSRDFTEQELASYMINTDILPGKYVYIKVSDTGCGIEKENLSKIFDPFYTTKFTGRGLGLAATIGIIRGHNGNVKVDSIPGEGATFTVIFPAIDAKAVNLEEEVVNFESDTFVGTVLVVDDEHMLCTVASEILKRLGFKTLIANNGREALDLIEKGIDDLVLILLDVTMPEMDGKEVYKALQDQKMSAPILFSSGYTYLNDPQLENDPSVGFIQKPYGPSELKKQIIKVLGR